MDINCDMIKNVLKLFIFVLSSFFFIKLPRRKFILGFFLMIYHLIFFQKKFVKLYAVQVMPIYLSM